MIAAIGENNEIGKGNKLLWYLPDDFKRFKELTMGNDIIMGRKTFESLPGILEGRNHIVLTKDVSLSIDGINVVNTIDDTLVNDSKVKYIIGGSQIYNQYIGICNKLEITKVHSTFNDADSFFPIIDNNKWELVSEDYHEKDNKHKYSFTYQTWARK